MRKDFRIGFSQDGKWNRRLKEESSHGESYTFFSCGYAPGHAGIARSSAVFPPYRGQCAGDPERNAVMSNTMKPVGEALRRFLEQPAGNAPLSDEERERLRQYNPTLAAQVEAFDWEALPSFLRDIIEEWRQEGGPCAKSAPHPAAVPEARRRPAPVSLEELAREQAVESAREVVRAAKPVPAPVPSEAAPGPLPVPAPQERPAVWCGYPTSIARVSPFFPMGNRDKGHRDKLIRDLDVSPREKARIVASGAFFFKEPISSGPWGDILYTGPKLSVEEEDVLMALLAIIESGLEGFGARHGRSVNRAASKENSKDADEGFVPVVPGVPEAPYVSGGVEAFPEPVRSAFPDSGTGTFTYKGPMLPILQLMGNKRPGQNHYARLVMGLKCLAHGTIELVVRERGEETLYDLTHIISNLRLKGKNDAERDISVTISPFFREMYVANRLTWIDVAKRFQIRGSIAKAMYRFCQSHRENPVFRGYIQTLAQALNMDSHAPLKETRRQVREAIAELVEKKVLEKTSILTRGNMVILNRTAEALPRRRAKK